MIIHYILNASILILAPIFYILMLNIISKFKTKDIIYLFLLGAILLLIFNSFLYSIGKNLSINLYFFSIDIRGNNIFDNFESNYKQFIKNLGTTNPLLGAFAFLILPGILEEIGKFLIFIKFYKTKITSISDSLVGMGIIALGFAFLENIYYLISYIKDLENGQMNINLIYKLDIIRGIISSWSHVFFSIIIGFFYGKARFAGFNIIDDGSISKLNNILKFIRKIKFLHINVISKIYSYKLIITGLFFAIFLHIIYNFVLSLNNIIFAIFILFFGSIYFYIFFILKEKNNFDYMRLEDKIEHLKKIKGLKDRKSSLFKS